MANELMTKGTTALAHKRVAKKAPKKAAKKHAKKAAKHVGEKMVSAGRGNGGGFLTAFHHMQRASSVISLMEKGTGEDLKELLKRGVKLYETAMKDDDESALLKAIGVLRAAEHLSMAGLYDARHKHRQKVDAPEGVWLEGFMAETDRRLKRVEHKERGKGHDLFPIAEELVRQAEDADHDPHMAYELVMAADALCFALENGL